LQKLKSTYADALVGEINPNTGRVHTSYAQAIASTGRLSSNDPNLQNIPIRTEEGSRIRHAFIAETGHMLVSADYSQIELRLLAHVADIPALKESFSRGEDIHARTASEVFGIPMAGMDSMTRRRDKAINFGIIYGISGFGLARQLGITPGEARTYSDAYFVRYQHHIFMERIKEEARINGYVTTVRPSLLGTGHRRQEPRAPRLCRTAGDQRPAARRWRRHHQARDGAAAECVGGSRAEVASTAAGARRTTVRGTGGRGAGAHRACTTGDGECGDAVGAAAGGDRHWSHLGRRALTGADRRVRPDHDD
jgi:hypothetical protein